MLIELGSIPHQGCQWQIKVSRDSRLKKQYIILVVTPRKSLQDAQTRADPRRHWEVLVSRDHLGMREGKLPSLSVFHLFSWWGDGKCVDLQCFAYLGMVKNGWGNRNTTGFFFIKKCLPCEPKLTPSGSLN